MVKEEENYEDLEESEGMTLDELQEKVKKEIKNVNLFGEIVNVEYE